MKAYEESQKTYWDNYSVLKTAKEKGRQEGRKEGIIAVAKTLKQNGVAIELIEKSTGLSKEEISKL